MKNFLWRKIVVFITIALILLAMEGCRGSEKDSRIPETTTEEKISIDPLGKYDPLLRVTSCIAVGADCIFAEGEDIHSNIWKKHYENDLGIKLDYVWTTDGSQYTQKLNLAIASNDMPDYFVVGPEQLKMLTESGQIWDVTTIYDKWSSEDTRRFFTIDPVAFKSAFIEKKMMGLPQIDSSLQTVSILWIRNDWLKNLNLQVPSTTADVLDIARAFAMQDPDKNGKNDTFGLGINKDLWTPVFSLTGFFNSFHAYVGGGSFWLKDESGKIVSGNTQPEVKTALMELQKLYKEGVLDKEFGVKDTVKVAEDTASGRIGMQYGAWWNPDWPLNVSKQKDPNADWAAYPITSIDNKPALHGYSNYVSSYIVVNKNFKNPEAVVKMMNYWWNIIKNPTTENVQKYIFDIENPSSGRVFYKYINVLGWDPNGKIESYKKVQEALKTGSTSGLGFEEMHMLANIDKYIKGDISSWSSYAEFGPQGSYGVLSKVAEGMGLANIFYGASTPVMAEKMPALIKMQNEVFTSIILGSPIENFDKFVNDWDKLGGNEITKEVNEWYSKNY